MAAPIGIITTQGFADVLRIGYQNRPKLFELSVRKPEPLFLRSTWKSTASITAEGKVLLALNTAVLCAN